MTGSPTSLTTSGKHKAPEAKPSGLFRQLGPGLIAGAANDDPSCIVTYSIAGAALGYLTLWTSLFLFPVVAASQLMCSRLAMVTGRGLAGDVRVHCGNRVLLPLCVGLLIANLVTLGADLGGMAEVTQMVTGVSALLWTVVYAIGITALLFFFPYRQIERILRWLCLTLFTYVIAAVLVSPDWHAVLANTFVPRVEWSGRYLSVLVAILGATVSPYFLFWQAESEVEAEYCLGRKTVLSRKGATGKELAEKKVDVYAGAFVSKLITYAITLTAAAALFSHGKRTIESARDAAAALQPIAGPAAFWLFALGVIGTGLLAIPVLAGSSAYAISEALHWRASLEDQPRFAPRFYGVLVAAVVVGLLLILFGVPVVQMLFWASVCNGILAPFCLVIVLLLTSRGTVMGSRVNPPWLRSLGWFSVAVTGTAAIAMLASFAWAR
ncbi:MAG TPA: divalent metal cation transporter [Bryobacteraceae bacterium]|nr:divalent metal cation transporter [Bryobacteraceae bacterium]